MAIFILKTYRLNVDTSLIKYVDTGNNKTQATLIH